MAGCFVSFIEAESNGDNLEARLPCVFFGSGLKDLSEVSITIGQSDTMIQVKQKIIDAIMAEATSLGHSLTAANIILPNYQRGG